MKKISISTLLACLLIYSSPLSANAGVPVIFISFPMMVYALVPIILLEFFIILKKLKVNWRLILKGVIGGNLVSTLFGFPLMWFFLLGFEAATTGMSCGPGFGTPLNTILTALFEAAWLCPYDKPLEWLIPIAIFINLSLALFISVFVEYRLLQYFTKFADKSVLKRLVWRANLVSYLALSFLGIPLARALNYL